MALLPPRIGPDSQELPVSAHIAELATKTLAALNPSGKVTVGVHVRRGDFTMAAVRSQGYAMATEEFLLTAMQTFRWDVSPTQTAVLSKSARVFLSLSLSLSFSLSFSLFLSLSLSVSHYLSLSLSLSIYI